MTMNTNEQGVVLGGYDVVSYFTEDRATRGSQEHSAAHGGATYYFSSPQNKALFQASPEKYTPEFGGYCAFGMAAHKMKVPCDPRTFKIYNGNLLLFFNDLHEGTPVNTKVMWNANEQQLYQDAASAWPSVK